MSLFKFTIYNSGAPIYLNLARALSVEPTDYKEARTIIRLGTNGAGEDLDYYVRESFEEVGALIESDQRAAP